MSLDVAFLTTTTANAARRPWWSYAERLATPTLLERILKDIDLPDALAVDEVARLDPFRAFCATQEIPQGFTPPTRARKMSELFWRSLQTPSWFLPTLHRFRFCKFL